MLFEPDLPGTWSQSLSDKEREAEANRRGYPEIFLRGESLVSCRVESPRDWSCFNRSGELGPAFLGELQRHQNSCLVPGYQTCKMPRNLADGLRTLVRQIRYYRWDGGFCDWASANILPYCSCPLLLAALLELDPAELTPAVLERLAWLLEPAGPGQDAESDPRRG